MQKRGRVILIGRLQLAPEKGNEEENKEIANLRMLRTQVRCYTYLVLIVMRLLLFLSLIVK